MRYIRMIMATLLSLSQLVHSEGFFVDNKGFSGDASFTSEGFGDVVLRNFRVRIIANALYGKDATAITDYLNVHHEAVAKTYITSILTQSDYAQIFGLSSPSKLLTVVVSADAFKDGEIVQKYMLYSEHLKIGAPIKPSDTITLELASISQQPTLHLDFTAKVDRNDGQGLVPVTIAASRYVSMR